jgi:hypothetical protein
MRLRFFGVAFFLAIGIASAYAGDPPNTYGVEVEFMKDRWQSLPSNRATEKFLYNQMYELKNEVESKLGLPNRISVGSRGKMEFTIDPGVIEIKVGPVTSREAENESFKLAALYSAAARKGLKPGTWAYGAHHIHIGVKESGMAEDPIALRNFLAYLFNHHEFAEGVLTNDPGNALSISLLPEAQKESIRDAFRQFDRSAKEVADSIRLIEGIRAGLYQRFRGGGGSAKRGAVSLELLETNIDQLTIEGTIEIRSMVAFKDPKEMVEMFRFFDGIIQFVKDKTTLIPLGNWKPIRLVRDRILRFMEMVSDSGRDWKEYRKLLSPNFKKVESGFCPALLESAF